MASNGDVQKNHVTFNVTKHYVIINDTKLHQIISINPLKGVRPFNLAHCIPWLMLRAHFALNINQGIKLALNLSQRIQLT